MLFNHTLFLVQLTFPPFIEKRKKSLTLNDAVNFVRHNDNGQAMDKNKYNSFKALPVNFELRKKRFHFKYISTKII